MTSIDLDSFAAQDTAVLHVTKPGSADLLGWAITMAGPNHPVAKKWADQAQRRNLKEQRDQQAAQINGRKYKPEEQTPDEQRANNAEWLATHIVGWEPEVKVDGHPLPYTHENAKRILMDRRYLFVFEQCVEFLGDSKSFIPRSAQTLPPSQSDTSD